MATAVIHPQNYYLGNTLPPLLKTPTRNPSFPNPNPSPKFSKSCCHKRSPVRSQSKSKPLQQQQSLVNQRRNRSVPESGAKSTGAKTSFVVGEVRILKRGEPLPVPVGKPTTENRELRTVQRRGGKEVRKEIDLVLGSMAPLGRDLVQMSVFDEKFAGSGFFASPPPSLVPVPSFIGKIRG